VGKIYNIKWQYEYDIIEQFNQHIFYEHYVNKCLQFQKLHPKLSKEKYEN
jgi:hypothetical protein